MRCGSLPHLRRRLTVAALLVSLFGGLAATALGMAVADLLLRPELEATGATVANGLARDLVHANELGIPLDQYPGMDAYLRNVVEDAPSVRMVTVRDAAGRELYGHGAAARWTVHEVSVPLVTQGATIGWVEVGLDRLVFLSYMVPEWALLAAVVMGAMLAAVWLTVGVASVHLFEPLAGAALVLVRGGRGDFRMAPRRVGLGSPRQLVEALTEVIRRLRHDWQDLREHAMAARAAHFDPAMLNRVDEVTQRLAQRFHLPVEDATGDTWLAARGGLRLATYLLVGAEAACLPSLASAPLMMLVTWGAALVVAVILPRLALVSGRSAVVSGALVAALGYVAEAGLDAEAGEMGARLVVGLGLGAALSGLGSLGDGWRGLLATPRRRDAVLFGVGVGALFGGLLAAALSSDAAFILAALSAAATVLIGRWLPPMSPGSEAAGRGMVLGTAVLIAGPALLLSVGPLAQWARWWVAPTGWHVEAFIGLVVAAAAVIALAVPALLSPRRRRRC